MVNICRGSRKDFRNAMVSARSASDGWSYRTAYNRAQILYRVAEMLEGRREQFMAELTLQGLKNKQAENEINQYKSYEFHKFMNVTYLLAAGMKQMYYNKKGLLLRVTFMSTFY